MKKPDNDPLWSAVAEATRSGSTTRPSSSAGSEGIEEWPVRTGWRLNYGELVYFSEYYYSFIFFTHMVEKKGLSNEEKEAARKKITPDMLYARK